MFKRNTHKVPSLNTTSTADISFMLLIFFLVTTSMDVDKGITRMLPPLDKEEKQELRDISKNNILQIELTDEGRLIVDGKDMTQSNLRKRVEEFVSTADREEHLIAIKTSRKAPYQRYFDMQNEIIAAYRELRDARAMEVYHRTLAQCSREQADSIRAYYPQRIAEEIEVRGGER